MAVPLGDKRDSTGKSTGRHGTVKVAPDLRNLPVDSSVRILGLHWHNKGSKNLPTLYVDGYTVMREVTDLCTLREGDHCLVGLPHAVFRTLSPTMDSLFASITSWEALPMPCFHHFVLLDSVASVSSEGPLDREGNPVRIAEYSDTIVNACRRVFADGWSGVWCNWLKLLAQSAKFHTPYLREYLPQFARRRPSSSALCHGLLVVCRELTAQQRRETCEAALALVDAEHQPGGGYNLVLSNCEHVAFMIDSTTRRWVSPQVPHNLWILFRLVLQLVGLICLVVLARAPTHYSKLHAGAATLYHIFATVPVTLQVQCSLVRICANLSTRRCELGLVAYDFLMVKETLRACIVGGITAGAVGMMPRLVWDLGMLRVACTISIAALGIANLIYNVAMQVVVRIMLAHCGVPILIFDDLRDTADQRLGASACSVWQSSNLEEPKSQPQARATSKLLKPPGRAENSPVRRRTRRSSS